MRPVNSQGQPNSFLKNESAKWDFVKCVNSLAMKTEEDLCKIDTSQEVKDPEWALRETVSGHIGKQVMETNAA